MKRRASLLAVVVTTLAACGVSDSSDTGSAAPAGLVEYGNTATVVVPVDQLPASHRDDSKASGLDTYSDPEPTLPVPRIDLSVLRSGGSPPDGIPSIDTPEFHIAASVDYLGDEDPVIALEIAGDARAYPLEILIWHELVNDTVGGVPVSVAYRPLCNSVTVYERHIAGQVLDFGVSSLLYNLSLVMYDR
jgi:hypothetical protein